MRPALFQLESGPETYQWTNPAAPRRTLEAKLFLYFDARDPTTTGSTSINNALDALDAALAPQAQRPRDGASDSRRRRL